MLAAPKLLTIADGFAACVSSEFSKELNTCVRACLPAGDARTKSVYAGTHARTHAPLCCQSHACVRAYVVLCSGGTIPTEPCATFVSSLCRYFAHVSGPVSEQTTHALGPVRGLHSIPEHTPPPSSSATGVRACCSKLCALLLHSVVGQRVAGAETECEWNCADGQNGCVFFFLCNSRMCLRLFRFERTFSGNTVDKSQVVVCYLSQVATDDLSQVAT